MLVYASYSFDPAGVLALSRGFRHVAGLSGTRRRSRRLTLDSVNDPVSLSDGGYSKLDRDWVYDIPARYYRQVMYLMTRAGAVDDTVLYTPDGEVLLGTVSQVDYISGADCRVVFQPGIDLLNRPSDKPVFTVSGAAALYLTFSIEGA